MTAINQVHTKGCMIAVDISKHFHNALLLFPNGRRKLIVYPTSPDNHYLTGVLFALIPLILSSQSWFYQPTLATGLFAGLISLFVPFLIMQPAFGFGLAASKTPVPMKSRTMSLLTHTSYGLGLYLTAKIINLVIS